MKWDGVVGMKYQSKKKYYIALINEYYETKDFFETDNPYTAIKKWLKYSFISPAMAYISCGSREDCMLLYSAFSRNKDRLYQDFWINGRMYYRFDYLLGNCNAYLQGRTLFFSGNRGSYDQVPIFSLG